MTLTDDMRLLAEAVLKGDESAALPLCDCVMENWKGKERITPHYVEMLEDTLREWKRELYLDVTGTYEQTQRGKMKIQYFKCEQVARSLNRQGLS